MRNLFLLLLIFKCHNVLAAWTPVNTGLNEDINDIVVWNNQTVISTNSGLYINQDISNTSNTFDRFVMNNTDSLIYNRIKFSQMVKYNTGIVLAIGQDTVQNKAIIFKLNANNLTYQFIHTSNTGKQFNTINKHNGLYYAMGMAGYTVEYDGSNAQEIYININWDIYGMNSSISSTNPKYCIVGDGYYATGYNSPTSNVNTPNLTSSFMNSVVFYTGSQFLVGGTKFYVASGNFEENTNYDYGTLNVTDMLYYSNKAYITTDHGIFKLLSNNSNSSIEYFPSSNGEHLLSITEDLNNVYASGKNGVILKADNPTNWYTQPYVDILTHYKCPNSFTYINVLKGSANSCKWYLNGTQISSSCSSYPSSSITDSISTISFVGTNGSFSDSVSTTFTILDSTNLSTPPLLIDTFLCKEGLAEFSIAQTQADRIYGVYDIDNNQIISNFTQGNDSSITLFSDMIYSTRQVRIEVRHISNECPTKYQDTIEVIVEHPEAMVHSSLINADVYEDVQFFALAKEATNFHWNFPIQSTLSSSIISNPITSFNTTDSVNLELISWTNHGCYDTLQTTGPTVVQDPYYIDSCYSITFNYIGSHHIENEEARIFKLKNGYAVTYPSYQSNIYTNQGTVPHDSLWGVYLAVFDDKDNLKWEVHSTVLTPPNNAYLSHFGGHWEVTEDSLGNIYIAQNNRVSYGTYFYDNTGDSVSLDNGLFFVKLNPKGKLLWYASTSNLEIRQISVAVDQNQRPFIAFSKPYSSTLTYHVKLNKQNTDTITSSFSSTSGSSFGLFFNSNGSLRGYIETNAKMTSSSSYFDSDNNLYLVMKETHVSAIRDKFGTVSNIAVSTSSGMGSFYFNGVVKLDSTGAFDWKVIVGNNGISYYGSEISDEEFDINGNLYFVGNHLSLNQYDSLIVEDAQGTFNKFKTNDYFFLKISKNGNVKWVNKLNYTWLPTKLKLCRDEYNDLIYVTGRSYGDSILSPDIFYLEFTSTDNQYLPFYMDYQTLFLAQYDTSGVIHSMYLNRDTSNFSQLCVKMSDLIYTSNGFRQIHQSSHQLNFEHFNIFNQTSSDGSSVLLHYNLNCGIQFLPTSGGIIIADTICAHSDITLDDGTTVFDVTSNYTYSTFVSAGNNSTMPFVHSYYVIPGADTLIIDTLCSGDDFTFINGNTQTNITIPDTVNGMYTTTNNCSYPFTTNIYISPNNLVVNHDSICKFQNYTLPDGNTLTNLLLSDTIDGFFYNTNQCSQPFTTYLKVFQELPVNNFDTICENGTYTFLDGTTQNNILQTDTISGYYLDQNQCYSPFTTVLFVNDVDTLFLTDSLCLGETYTTPDAVSYSNLTQQDTFTGWYVNSNLCNAPFESIVTPLPLSYSVFYDTVCEGTTYTYPDGAYYAIFSDTMHESTFTNINGCDSIVTTQISVVQGIDVSYTQGYDTVYLSNPAIGETYQWYYCENGLLTTSINNANTSGIYVDSTANFALEINNDYCSDTTDCVVFDFTGLDDHSQLSINIYPNPTSGIIYITNNFTYEYEIVVKNAQGKIILIERANSYSHSIDLEKFSRGIYFVQINNYTERIILSH